jgi:hypothetical protein
MLLCLPPELLLVVRAHLGVRELVGLNLVCRALAPYAVSGIASVRLKQVVHAIHLSAATADNDAAGRFEHLFARCFHRYMLYPCHRYQAVCLSALTLLQAREPIQSRRPRGRAPGGRRWDGRQWASW